jgi:methyl-accepting chemotaxis protein
MKKTWTFSSKLMMGFAVLVGLSLTIAMLGIYALNRVVASKDSVIDVNAQTLIDAETLNAAVFLKSAAMRGYVLTGQSEFRQKVQDSRVDFQNTYRKLDTLETDRDSQAVLQQISRADADYDVNVTHLIEMKDSGGPADAIARYMANEAQPSRRQIETLVEQFAGLETKRLEQEQAASTATAVRYRIVVILFSAVIILAAFGLATVLNRSLSGDIGSAVQDIQSSSTELQTTATQQATGAREQATAMTEITTTMSELLATARQIAESAQRVSGISNQTAASAQTGDKIVRRAGDSIGGIKRQVDQVVNHMLDLGRKSQHISGVVEIISELAEQTNILAINAAIEAAGAGEAGRRFGVVAEEIRKLADRVAGTTKDVRNLIDDVQAAVNSTIMATETSSKAVDTGTRDFSDLANSLTQVVSLAATTSEAAREIELSTRQQSSAVEQVNGAVANVAQVSREAEASTTQAMQTAAELATLAKRLTILVRDESIQAT